MSINRAFCKIPQARVLWVGRGDRESEGQVSPVPEWPQEAQKRHWARLEPYFVTFVLFVVEPLTQLAGQRELSREKPGERSLAGQVRSLLFHGDARFRILQTAPLYSWSLRRRKYFRDRLPLYGRYCTLNRGEHSFISGILTLFLGPWSTSRPRQCSTAQAPHA